MSVVVLVVDDDDDIRFLTTMTLEATAGWEVRTASGGHEAVASALERLPDVVLLDLMMPGTDGLATTRLLREDPRTAAVPIILLTAKASVSGAEPWAGADVTGVLTKPFDPMRLADSIRAILDWT